MYGVIDGLYFCNYERLDEINSRISERNIPSQELRPEYSLRPVSTKYAILPIVDRVPVSNVPLKQYSPYNISTVFNPGTSQGPWRGFAENINIDSSLRNQFFALQKAGASKFIPSSEGSLYKSHLAINGYPKNEYLSSEFINQHQSLVENLGNETFNNCTRCERINIKVDRLC